MKQLKKHTIGYNTVSSVDGVISARGVKSKPNDLQIFGYTNEVGEGEKSPDNLYKLISLDSGAMTVDNVEYEHSIKLTNNNTTIQVPTPILLNSVKGVSDYIIKDNDGIWKLMQNLYKLELTGQESGYYHETNTNAYGLRNSTFRLKSNYFKNSSTSICTALVHLDVGIASTRYESYRFFHATDGNYLLYFKFLESRIASLADLIAYIQNQYEIGEPLIVVYQLETPVEHTLSDYAQQLLNSFVLQNQNEIFVEGYPDIKISGYIQN